MNNISIFWYIKLFDQYSSSLYLSMFFFLFFTFYVYRIYIFISDLSNNNILWCVHANSPTPTTVQLQDLYHSLNSHNVMIVMTPRFYFIIMHYTSFVLLFSASITKRPEIREKLTKNNGRGSALKFSIYISLLIKISLF